MCRIARHLFRDPHVPDKAWPADCTVQWGMDLTGAFAFFEAFPSGGGFHRAEGATIAIAEASCLATWRRTEACAHPGWDRKGREDGGAYCTACKLFRSGVFAPTTICCQCGTPCYYTQDNQGRWWCEACAPRMPDALLTELDRESRAFRAQRDAERAANVAAGRSFACDVCGPEDPRVVDYGETDRMAICRGCDVRYFLDDQAARLYAEMFGPSDDDRRFPRG